MSTRMILTIAANVFLFGMLCRYRTRYCRLFLLQCWSMLSTSIMLAAQLIPHTLTGDALYNGLWTTCDLADIAAECLCLYVLWCGMNLRSILRPALIVAMLVHADIALQEYWAHDVFHLNDWKNMYEFRQWLNLAIILGLTLMVTLEQRIQRQGEIEWNATKSTSRSTIWKSLQLNPK